jgi:hypothetical protein
MEYRRSYRDEQPDWGLIDRHEREIFPLMKKRYLFSGSADYCLFDLRDGNGVNENVFAYSNRAGNERALVFYNNAYSQASGWIREGSANIPQKDGTTRRDSLCQALGLHGEGRYFALLREQRQNRWFIRSSKDIAERGFFVSLNGYEAQVFLDIHEVEDAAPGTAEYRWDARWSKLNAELNGRGVEDLHGALQDIFLGDLYAPFVECFTQGRIAELTALVTAASPQKKEAAVFAESFAKPVETFISQMLRYLDGAGGRYEPFPATVQAKPKDGDSASLDAKVIQHIVKEFTAYIEWLVTFGKADKPAAKTGKVASKDAIKSASDSKTVSKSDPGEKFLLAMADEISERPLLAVYGIGCGLFWALRTALGKPAGGEYARALIQSV